MAGLGAAAALPGVTLPEALHPSAGPRNPDRPAYLFFDAAEAGFIEAACERLIPADSAGPGASEVGVVEYVDRQLASPWGAGEQSYRDGPWQPGTPALFQPALVKPAALFRAALCAIRRDLATRAATCEVRFGELPTAVQDAYLRSLEPGGAELDGVPSTIFFRLLLTMTVEGYFSNPLQEISRDRVNWRMHGFPGAHAAASRAAGSARPCQEAPGEVPQPSLD